MQRTEIKGDDVKSRAVEEILRKELEIKAIEGSKRKAQENEESREQKKPFEKIWGLIKAHAEETFHTKTNLEFTYKVDGDGVYPSRTNYRLSKTDFKTAFEMVPIDGPGAINDIVRGPAYIWAILHDKRISQGEW